MLHTLSLAVAKVSIFQYFAKYLYRKPEERLPLYLFGVKYIDVRGMKNFLKQNWFKLGLFITAIVALLFYLVSGSSNEEKDLLANSIKCNQEGTKLLEREKRELSGKQSYGNPEFRFVPELNTCLYRGSLVSEGREGFAFLHFIRDVYTNRDLAEYVEFENLEPDSFGIEEYRRLEQEYFSQ